MAIEGQLKNLREEAEQTKRETNRALDRLSQLESDMQMKQKQSQLENAEFYSNLMMENKTHMASMKYKSPLAQIYNSTSKIYFENTVPVISSHQQPSVDGTFKINSTFKTDNSQFVNTSKSREVERGNDTFAREEMFDESAQYNILGKGDTLDELLEQFKTLS